MLIDEIGGWPPQTHHRPSTGVLAERHLSPMATSAAIPRAAPPGVRAFGTATLLLAIYVVATEWLVSLGPKSSPALLSGQAAVYSSLATGSLLLIRARGGDGPFAGRPGLRWISILSVSLALVVLAVRFVWKHPSSTWRIESAQGWRDITEGYLVGRALVPLTEELVFRGVLFRLFDTGGRTRSTAVVIGSAAVFAILHWPPLYGLPASGGATDILSALAAGLAFGALTGWTKSILPSLGLHVIGNAVGF